MSELLAAAVALFAYAVGWLMGRLDRETQDHPRRRFNHENTNRPSGPPPLRLRRSGDGYSPGPTTPKPDIIPQGQDPGPVRHISVGYQPLPWVQGPANPLQKEP